MAVEIPFKSTLNRLINCSLQKLVFFSTFLLVLLLPLHPEGVAQSSGERPNILFAFADDWGYPDASVYGQAGLETPNFDRVARQGALFERAFVASPSCTPSRGAVLSGQHVWRLGPAANLWSTMPEDVPLYTDLLEQAGYHVGHTRKGWGPGRLKPGGRKQNPAGPKFKNFSSFLDQRNGDQPFCFWFGSKDPHRPYSEDLRENMNIDPADVDVPPYFPDVSPVRRDLANYFAEVQRFDRDVGRLLNLLEKRDELQNTIVVVAGDHGMPFPRAKTHLYDSGSRVPLAVQWPSRMEAGQEITSLVNLADLAPTFLKAAGISPPEAMTGRSLWPLLTGDGSDHRHWDRVFLARERHVVAQEAPETGGYPMRAIRTGDYLYIRNLKPNRWPSGTPYWKEAQADNAWLADCDNGPTKFYLWANRNDSDVETYYDLAFTKRPAVELYDLEKDPHQMHNVAGTSQYEEVQERLKKQLLDELKSTNDPRVTGSGEKFDDYPYYGGAPSWPGKETFEQYKN